jgi:hypothetical protein
METKTQNILLWVLIVFFSIGILALGYAISQKKSRAGLPMNQAEALPPELPELRLSAFMSPDVNTPTKTKTASAPAGEPRGEMPALVGGGDLKQLSKPKSRRIQAPKGKARPKMKMKRRK